MRAAATLVLLIPYALSAADPVAFSLAGRWNFSVDMEGGGHGAPVIRFKQDGRKISGVYRGPLGIIEFTGAIEQEGWLRHRSDGTPGTFTFSFAVEGSRDGKPFRAVYSGSRRPDGTLAGTVEMSGSVVGRGVWTATREVPARTRSAAKDAHVAR